VAPPAVAPPARPATVLPSPVVEAPLPPAPLSAPEPLAGLSDGTPFLRSPDGDFVLFPGAQFQVDVYTFRSKNKTPNNTFLLRSARLDLGGWVGPWVYFFLSGEFAQAPPPSAAPVAPANLLTADEYVALAPWNNLAILQVGQFNAPFTLENRISSKYTDFMERSITVRAFGIPDNREMGAMLHGFNDERFFYYSVGTFNGDGQNFKNADNHFDWMGRAWFAPLALAGAGPLHDVEIGASLWTGERANTLAPAAQSTQAGFTFFNTAAFTATPAGSTTAQSIQLRQNGRLNAFAVEVNAPVAHRLGLRGEFVWKHSPLSEESIASSGAGTVLGGADLQGYSFYGQASVWVIGDDRIVGDQQSVGGFPRYAKFGIRRIENGLMLALRYEHLDETLTEDATAAALNLGNKSVGRTKVDSGELGINYWHSKRYRATFNYVVNHFGGDTPFITGLPSAYEQELLLRLAVAF
jgi:phosphate-selective porin